MVHLRSSVRIMRFAGKQICYGSVRSMRFMASEIIDKQFSFSAVSEILIIITVEVLDIVDDACGMPDDGV